MPIYEYRCPNCGDFEAIQKITEEPLKVCPTCGANVKKLISHSVGIIFKGPGFYATDNRSEDYKSKAKEEQGESKGREEKGETKVADQ